jgi:RNA polymerase subunit RPABC4/transcription elongation factor Spt4
MDLKTDDFARQAVEMKYSLLHSYREASVDDLVLWSRLLIMVFCGDKDEVPTRVLTDEEGRKEVIRRLKYIQFVGLFETILIRVLRDVTSFKAGWCIASGDGLFRIRAFVNLYNEGMQILAGQLRVEEYLLGCHDNSDPSVRWIDMPGYDYEGDLYDILVELVREYGLDAIYTEHSACTVCNRTFIGMNWDDMTSVRDAGGEWSLDSEAPFPNYANLRDEHGKQVFKCIWLKDHRCRMDGAVATHATMSHGHPHYFEAHGSIKLKGIGMLDLLDFFYAGVLFSAYCTFRFCTLRGVTTLRRSTLTLTAVPVGVIDDRLRPIVFAIACIYNGLGPRVVSSVQKLRANGSTTFSGVNITDDQKWHELLRFSRVCERVFEAKARRWVVDVWLNTGMFVNFMDIEVNYIPDYVFKTRSRRAVHGHIIPCRSGDNDISRLFMLSFDLVCETTCRCNVAHERCPHTWSAQLADTWHALAVASHPYWDAHDSTGLASMVRREISEILEVIPGDKTINDYDEYTPETYNCWNFCEYKYGHVPTIVMHDVREKEDIVKEVERLQDCVVCVRGATLPRRTYRKEVVRFTLEMKVVAESIGGKYTLPALNKAFRGKRGGGKKKH